tara:strand:+ start:63 stop:491 length:429 start_codon:yes stop_codon:yes gene_type:complete
MPKLSTKVFNKSIDINYENKDKNKLLQHIDNFNIRLKKYENLNGKVSDIKIIILAALEIIDDLSDKEKTILENNSILKSSLNKDSEVNRLSSEIVSLKDKINLLESQISKNTDGNDEIEKELEEIAKILENLNKNMISFYDE